MTRATRWTRTRIAGMAISAAVIIAAGVAVAATRGGAHGPAAVPVRANSLAELDVTTGRVVGDVPLPSAPSLVIRGGGSLWVAEEQLDTVVRVDPKTLKSLPAGVGIDPGALAYGAGSLWAYDAVGRQAARIDPNILQNPTPTTFRLPACPKRPQSAGQFYSCQLGGIAVADGSVWIGRAIKGDPHDLGVLWQFNPHSPIPKLTATISGVPATEIVYGAGSLWTAGTWASALVTQINPSTRSRIGPWNVPGGLPQEVPFGMTWFDNYTWVVSATPVLAPLGPSGNPDFSGDNVPLSQGATDVGGGGGYLWVTNDDGTLAKINPNTRNVIKTYPLHHPAYGVAYTNNRVWVTVT